MARLGLLLGLMASLLPPVFHGGEPGWAAQAKPRSSPRAGSATTTATATAAVPAAGSPPGAAPATSAVPLPASAIATDTAAELQIQDLLNADRLEEAVAAVDRWLATLPDPEPVKPRLAAALHQAVSARLASAPATDWPPTEAGPVEAAARKARDLAPDQLAYWQTLLDCIARQPGTEATLTFEGQDLLDRHGAALRRQPPADFIPLLQRLNQIFDLRGFPLHRLEVIQILARHPATASEAARLLPLARETVKLRVPELLERIEAAMVLNELNQAQSLLDRLKAAHPDLPQLARLTTRLETIRKVQDLLGQTYAALQRKDTLLAKRLCQQVLELDPHNFNARAYLDQIAATASPTAGPRAADPYAARKRDLAQRLARAEGEEDLAEIRNVLKEMILMGWAHPPHFRRLAEVEKELATARLLANERFEEAQRLLLQEDWRSLHRFLNRNPALGNNLDRIAAVWDMRLAAAYFTGARDDDELLADAARIAAKNPKSFWSPYVRMMIALRRNEMAEAEKHLEAARAIAAEHKYLIWPGRLLWIWRHGWKFMPFLLLAFFYVAGKGMFWFFQWWEINYWSRTAFIGRYLPRLALASLERRFGTVKEEWARQRMFELLAEFAFACGLKDKGVRYAELLLELKNQHPLAMQLLARHYLASPLKVQQIEFFLRYLKLFPDDKEAIQKLGRFLLAGKQLKPDHLELARRYMALFPEDQDMVVAVGQLLQETDPLSMTAEMVDLLEKAWRISSEDALWWATWRAQVVKGWFERAMAVLTEALQAGRPIPVAQLPTVLESQLDPAIRTLHRDLSGFDKTKQGEAQARLLQLKFVTPRQADLLLPYLDGLIGDSDPGIRYTAQKARDHLRKACENSAAFTASLLAMGGMPSSHTPATTSAGESPTAGGDGGPTAEPAAQLAAAPLAAADPATGEAEPATAAAPADPLAPPPELAQEGVSGQKPNAGGLPPRRSPDELTASPAEDKRPPSEPAPGLPDQSAADDSAQTDQTDQDGLKLTGGIRYDASGHPIDGSEPSLAAPPPFTPSAGQAMEVGGADGSGDTADLPLTGGVEAPATREALPTPPPSEPSWPASVLAWPVSEGASEMPSGAENGAPLPAAVEEPASASPPQPPYPSHPNLPISPVPTRRLFADLDAIVPPPPPSLPTPVARHLFVDLPGPAPDRPSVTPPSLPDQDVDHPQPLSPRPPDRQVTIAALPDDPDPRDLITLIDTSSPADLPAWETFLRRPPSPRCLEIAVKALGRLHSPEVTPVLRPFLQHPHPRVRANTIEGLQENGDPGAIPYLIPFLKDADNRIRANAIHALAQFKVEAILDEVKKMAADDRPRMRDSATWVLKGLRGKEAAIILQSLLADPEPTVRQNAIRALAQQGDPSNAQALQAFLAASPDPTDAALARKALQYIQTVRQP